MTTCHKCGKSWTGLKPEHCTICHETFVGTKAGDLHRTGKHGVRVGPDARRCRSLEEMAAVGMEVGPKGSWRIAKPANSQGAPQWSKA